MKKKLSRILGVGLTLGLLTSLMVGAAPASALNQPRVTIVEDEEWISLVDPDYVIRFTLDVELVTAGDVIILTFPDGYEITDTNPCAVAATGDGFALAEAGDAFTITAAAADSGTIAVTAGSAAVTVTGDATWVDPDWDGGALGGTVVVTATADDTAGTWARTTTSTAAITADVTNADVEVTATTGWIAGAPEVAAVWANVTWAGDEDDLTITGTLGAGDQFGEGSDIRVAITAGITNPSTPGTYTLTVETTEEDDAVTSGAFAITTPTVDALPGIVTIYNPDGHLMDQATGPGCIGDMIAAAGEGYTIEIGEGVYTEWSLNTTWDDLTIVATGDVWSTEVHAGLGGAGWEIDSEGVTIDGLFLIEASPFITADDATVQNCVIEYFWWGWGRGLVIAAEDATVTGNRFDAIEETWGVDTPYTAIGLYVGWGASSDGALISGNEFNVDETRFGIVVEAGALEEITIEDNTFTGNSGTGILVVDGTVDISGDNTLGGLAIGLDIWGGTVTVTDAAISQCGTAAENTPLDPTDGTPAILIAGGTVSITNSDISNAPDYAIVVGAAAGPVDIMFNTITGNLLNIYTAFVGTVNATHNWWGVDTGADEDTIVGLNDTTLVDVSDFLGDIAAGIFDTNTGILDAETEAGVTVETTFWIERDVPADGFDAPPAIGVANYDENPQSATPEPALEGGFYDVFVSLPHEATEIVIRFYNANITENTVIYVWGTIAGGWVPCAPEPGEPANQGVNMFGGFAYVKVTALSTPSLGDLTGTPFALCEPPVEIAAPASVLPILGAADVSLTPTLTWDAVDDATSYEVEVAADSTFATVDYSADSVVNGHLVAEDLDYGTTYYWRVRTISDTLTSSWSAGSMFTTVAEEPEPEIALPEIVFPAIGAMGVTNEPTYSWEAVEGADHYDFEVAEDLGLLTKDDPFAMLDYSTSCLINAHAAKEALKLESSYYWRVRTVIDLEEGVEVGAWVTGYFTVMGEPEEAEPPIVVEEITPVTPEITIEPVVIPPQEVTIEIAPDEVVQVIPDYLLWIIVVVGAVLIIAVIVLIVRTRRVA